MVENALVTRSPFENLAAAERGEARGVVVTDRDGLGLATVIARRGQLQLLEQGIRERYAIDLPGANRRIETRDIAFAAIGPDTWLATREQGGNEFAAALGAEFGAVASVSDQTDGYAVLRVSGPNVRDALCKLIPIDLHPCMFKPGDVASTVAAHMGVTLWRMNDAADGTPVFELAMSRSLAGSFWHALAQSAAEFGLV
jgi:methylglutamate dehydrogenase subunit D